jgi:hypothetical protein
MCLPCLVILHFGWAECPSLGEAALATMAKGVEYLLAANAAGLAGCTTLLKD